MNILYSIKDFLYYNRYKIIGVVGALFLFFYFKEEKQNSVGDKDHLNNSNNIENDAKVSNSKNTNNEKVSINKASKEDLMTLKGIGETKALAIINYRKEHGNFKSISELQNVKGIGKSIFEKIKDNIEL